MVFVRAVMVGSGPRSEKYLFGSLSVDPILSLSPISARENQISVSVPGYCLHAEPLFLIHFCCRWHAYAAYRYPVTGRVPGTRVCMCQLRPHER